MHYGCERREEDREGGREGGRGRKSKREQRRKKKNYAIKLCYPLQAENQIAALQKEMKDKVENAEKEVNIYSNTERMHPCVYIYKKVEIYMCIWPYIYYSIHVCVYKG